jgi:hypothetical protein
MRCYLLVAKRAMMLQYRQNRPLHSAPHSTRSKDRGSRTLMANCTPAQGSLGRT